jgi:hypothetical protein
MAAAPSAAQGKPEIFNIPLSRPGEPISLDVGMKSAHITVIGEDRADAEFEVSIESGERVIVTPSGPQSISNSRDGGSLNKHDRRWRHHREHQRRWPDYSDDFTQWRPEYSKVQIVI